MLIRPVGTMPEKFPVDTLVSVLKRRLKGEKDVSIRRFLRARIAELRQDYPPSPHEDPFLVCC